MGSKFLRIRRRKESHLCEVVSVTKQKKSDAVLEQFAETLVTRYGKAKKIILDTGPQKGKYRVVAKLKRKVCPECKLVHYSSLPESTCLDCTVVLQEERRLGRKMTPQERMAFLKEIDL